MKFIRQIFLAAACLLVILLHTTCNKNPFSTVTCKGYVYDHIGGPPAPGVWVYLSACDGGTAKSLCNNFTVGQAQTDASGHFYIHNEAAASDRYCLSFGTGHCGTFNTSKADLDVKDYVFYLH